MAMNRITAAMASPSVRRRAARFNAVQSRFSVGQFVNIYDSQELGMGNSLNIDIESMVQYGKPSRHGSWGST
jgi:hypothetical protein